MAHLLDGLRVEHGRSAFGDRLGGDDHVSDPTRSPVGEIIHRVVERLLDDRPIFSTSYY